MELGARRHSRIGVIGGLMCVLGIVPPVLAQSRADPPLGASWESSPGYYRIPVVAAAEPGVNLAAGFGYGYTESQSAAPGSHHRLEGRLAASLEPLPGFGLAFGTNLRHDQHADDSLGADQGTVIDSDVHAQLGTRVAGDFHLGGALGAAFTRGPTLGNSLENPAIDVSFLGAYLPLDAPFSAGLRAGFRYDRTARAARDPALYRAGDRLSLELSQFDAMLLGLGASYRIVATELLAKLSGDVLVGTGAP
ncbi:MAG TPA: hypothetical protein VG963_34225, partial [Polyangiaceae bacterium]|nr:hypothetical protein [Polyangiaceae bacterium]